MNRNNHFWGLVIIVLFTLALNSCSYSKGALRVEGDRILFLSDKDDRSQWYLMDPSGKDIESIDFPISEGFSLESLSWQNEFGGFFLTVSNVDGKMDFYSYKFGDESIRQISHDGGLKDSITYSKDAEKIAFICYNYGFDICIMDMSGKNFLKLTTLISNETNPHFIASGKEILFVSTTTGIENIWTVDDKGKNYKNLSNIGFRELNPDISADGSMIVFESQRDLNWNIFTMNIDGTSVKNLTNSTSSNRLPQWSPDDRKIGFLSDRDGVNDIFVMNSDGSDIKNLTKEFSGKVQSFIWSGDSNNIYFVGLKDDYLQIFSANIETGAIMQITNEHANHTSIAWIGIRR